MILKKARVREMNVVLQHETKAMHVQGSNRAVETSWIGWVLVTTSDPRKWLRSLVGVVS